MAPFESFPEVESQALDRQIVSRRLGISDLIRSLHAQLTESLEHEHCNLSEIQRVVTSRDLFDSIFDFEPEDQTRILDDGEKGRVVMTQTATIDRIGYPLSVRVSFGKTMVVLFTSESVSNSGGALNDGRLGPGSPDERKRASNSWRKIHNIAESYFVITIRTCNENYIESSGERPKFSATRAG